MVRALIDQRMLDHLGDFYPSRCNIQARTDAQDGYGEPIPTWANLAGHVNLPCALAPFVIASPQQAEMRRPDGTIVVATHHLSIAGHFPSITPSMRAVVSGVTYNILSVEWDSLGQTTRCRLELLS